MSKKEKGAEIEKFAAETLEQLLEKLQVEAKVDVAYQETEDGGSLDVRLDTDSAGLLIGQHGSTLGAIESFLNMALKQSSGEWVRVSLDIDGWREKQEGYLMDLAQQAAGRARATGERQHLYNLDPSQRRIVHMALGQEEGIETQSEGEGEGRYLVVMPKDK